MASTSCQSPITTSPDPSKNTAPPTPRLIGVHGRVCFWPVSAMAANHGPFLGALSHASISGFCDLFRYRYPFSSLHRWLHRRRLVPFFSFCGAGCPGGCIQEQAQAHASQMYSEPGQRHLFWSVKFAPCHLRTCMPLLAGRPHNQQVIFVSEQPTKCGNPANLCTS